MLPVGLSELVAGTVYIVKTGCRVKMILKKDVQARASLSL
jgi:hypothetical protein